MAAISAISDSESSKSNTSKFSSILSLWTDLGMTTTPRCSAQRSITCAAVLPCASPIPLSTGSPKSPPLPSPKGAQDSSCTP